MVLESPGKPLVLRQIPVPQANNSQVILQVLACGVCRTDLHISDGELAHPVLPLVLGHEIIGRVVHCGQEIKKLREGDCVGVPWLGYTCGTCRFCRSGRENLCENAVFTGYTRNGGYAEYVMAEEAYCFPLAPERAKPPTAPLLCAGLIGYRSYCLLGDAVTRLGIFGFGVAAHILIQVALFQQKQVYAFTRDGDRESQEFARSLGASWAGGSSESPPERLDGALIFAPVGSLVPQALRLVDKGGSVVCGGIHMSDIPSFPYEWLWEERVVRSVANLTRKDGESLLRLAAQIPVKTKVQLFPLASANEALDQMRQGKIQGAAVLIPEIGPIPGST